MGSENGNLVSPGVLDQDETKLLNYCIIIGPGQRENLNSKSKTDSDLLTIMFSRPFMFTKLHLEDRTNKPNYKMEENNVFQ
ncbi:hypothetical protein TNCV_1505401 [Trichonephila clavipes]|nr:hypothetical protein TNCV_1505401 [Trichonephila clavipes]